MSVRNTREQYGWVSILFHWGMAISIFGLFGLGLYMVELTYYDSWYHGSLATHKSIGILVATAWLLRLMWRWVNPSPVGLSVKRWENLAAHLAHMALYLVMLALFVSGYLISTADGDPIKVFEWFKVPATLTGDNQEDIAGKIHNFLAWGLMALVALHMAAALKHHFFTKDRTLIRMLKSK
jgi:cytochrome b561